MSALVDALDAVLPAAWTAAALAYLLVFLREDEALSRWARRLLVGALALHVAFFIAIGASGFPPVASVEGLVGGIGFAAGSVYLVLERRIGSRTIGVFPIGIGALLVLVGAALGEPLQPMAPELLRPSTAAHVAGAMLGYTSILLAAVFGVLFLVQRGAMRGRRFGLFWERLPSLELLDAFSRSSVVAAFLFLTVTIGFGHAVRNVTAAGEGYWDVKVIFANAIWAISGVVVGARFIDRMRPMPSALICVGLLFLAVLSMLLDPLSSVHGSY